MIPSILPTARMAMTLIVAISLVTAATGFPAFGQSSSLLQAPPNTRDANPSRSPSGLGGSTRRGAGNIDPRVGVPSAPAQLPTPTLEAPGDTDANPFLAVPDANTSPYANAAPQANTGQPNVVPAGGSFGNEKPPLYLSSASWTHQPATPMRVFRKNDIITIRVDEITRVMAEGSSESRKRTLYEALLTDWIRLDDFRLRPDPQGFGDPGVATESNNNFRAESTVESREAMTFSIAAKIVDIRPNGSLLLEARKAIRVNDNLWETALSGSCRIEDIAPDNVVLSRDLIDLEIRKNDRGHLRDGYKRGWFQRWFDRIQPF